MSVEEFCVQVGISRASFYRIRQRTEREGLAAAMTPRSRAPRRPARVWQATDERIAQVRADLVAAGREAGPASVWWVMSQGDCVPAPSRATIARSLRANGLVVPAPRKRPRTSYKRFTRSAANELWQIDGFLWRLSGSLVTVYQVVDDCSRAITTPRACCWGGEGMKDTRTVLEEAFTSWGRPAAILSDNASAFNTSRTTGPGVTEKWLASLGVRPISGRVGHPQTQSKVGRSHQPAIAWLRAHPVNSLEELNADLDSFTAYYNTERQHQGHGVALTPLRVWTQVPRAMASPVPIDLERLPAGGGPISLPDPASPEAAVDRARRSVMSNGCLNYKNRVLSLGEPMRGVEVTLVEYPMRLDLYDPDGCRFASLPWPQPTQREQGNRAAIDTKKPP